MSPLSNTECNAVDCDQVSSCPSVFSARCSCWSLYLQHLPAILRVILVLLGSYRPRIIPFGVLGLPSQGEEGIDTGKAWQGTGWDRPSPRCSCGRLRSSPTSTIIWGLGPGVSSHPNSQQCLFPWEGRSPVSRPEMGGGSPSPGSCLCSSFFFFLR